MDWKECKKVMVREKEVWKPLMQSFFTVILLLSVLAMGAEAGASPTPGMSRQSGERIQRDIPPSNVQGKHNVAIIIDDFGNNMRGTEDMLRLPFPLTVAVMPFMETSGRDAEWAHLAGHDVIVHMPMEPKQGKRSWLGPGAITSGMDGRKVRELVHAAIDDVPYAVGMNNHMGSRIIEDRRIMRIVLEVCKERGLFFLDSRTSSKSVVPELARELHMPYVENHIFFDDVNSQAHIFKQLKKLMEHSKTHDCIGIGHVGITGPNMAASLKQASSQLIQEARLVGVSEMAKPRKAYVR